MVYCRVMGFFSVRAVCKLRFGSDLNASRECVGLFDMGNEGYFVTICSVKHLDLPFGFQAFLSFFLSFFVTQMIAYKE